MQLARQASAAGATVFGTVRSSIPAELSSLAKTTPISGVDVVKPESLKTLIEELKKNASHLDVRAGGREGWRERGRGGEG